MVLEGGYDLEALEVSSEAVFKVLQSDPRDTESFNNLLTDLGAAGETYDSLTTKAMEYPRYSFRVMMSNLSKLVKKQWPFVEELIFEKPRRKSTAQSKKSKETN